MVTGFLLDVLIGVPATLGKEILEKIRDEVDRERLTTEKAIKERLQQLQLMLQDDELGEEEYEELEARLIERLRAVREYSRSQRGE
jgi:predicted DNA-binding protein (UPF0278 family)